MSSYADRIARMRGRAVELARSGNYKSWVEIERSLIAEGFLEARVEFNSPSSRSRVDEVCRIAQGALARGVTYDQAMNESRGGKG